jgi:hypothetical protein
MFSRLQLIRVTPFSRDWAEGEQQKMMIDTCVLVTGVQIAAALLGIAAAICGLTPA